jgi:hypothetical protein
VLGLEACNDRRFYALIKERQMKHFKMLGLAAAAALVLLAFGAGTASATTLCGTTSTPCNSGYGPGTIVEGVQKAGTNSVIETTGGTHLHTCTGSTFKAKTNVLSATWITANVEEWTWSGCDRFTVTVKKGKLELDHISATHNATLVGKETEVTVNTIFGSCIYGLGAGTTLGTAAGGPSPSITINTIIARLSGPCPAEARWTGTYWITKPTPLYFEP